MGHGVGDTEPRWHLGEEGRANSSSAVVLPALVGLQTRAGPRRPSGGLGPTQDVEAPGAQTKTRAALLRNHTQSQDQSSLFTRLLSRPWISSWVGADGRQLQLVPGLRGVSWLLLEGVTETQLDATPSTQPHPCPPTATLQRTGLRPGAWGQTPTGKAAPGTSAGSSVGSSPPLSRNLEKVSRSLAPL